MITSTKSLHEMLRNFQQVPTVAGIHPTNNDLILHEMVLDYRKGEASKVGATTVMETLLRLTELISPLAGTQWCEVFRVLGCAHPGAHRWDIILGLARAAEYVSPMVWIPTWINAGAMANIHPVSHLLCMCPETPLRVQQAIESSVNFENLRQRWFAVVTDIRDVEELPHRGWILMPSKKSPIRNLLASEPVTLWAAPGEAIVDVGAGSCLFALNGAMNERYRTIRLRENAVVVGDINASSIPQASVERGCQVGGSVVARRILNPGFGATERGIRWKGNDYHFSRFHPTPADVTLQSPVVIPPSLGVLVSHLKGCSWFSS